MDNASVSWPAPAKINLFLHITGRRADGMHELQTAFQFIDLCDEMAFEVRTDPAIIRTSNLPGVSQDQDLSLRAARLLQQKANIRQGVAISLKKVIPMGGGLGGASSNAATTLLALNKLWQAGCSTEELAIMGEQLGADVPVFIYGHAAWAEGIGEQLTPINLHEYWYVVINSQIHVNTREMFADSQLTRNCPTLTICPPEPGVLGNVFEPIVRARYREIDQVFNWLSQYASPFLTGTGGCVLASFADQASALSVQANAPPGLEVFVVKSKNVSPVVDRLSV
jgi:4-diphosphocytidyl-2-C-methyl-D-erythritol kinase